MDAGWTLTKGDVTGGPELGQLRVKADFIAEGLHLSGIDAMALAGADWKLGKPFVLDLVRTHELPVVAANLRCGDERPFPPSVTVERGGRKVGIVGLAGGPVAGCTLDEPSAALQAAVDGLGEVDLVLALLPFDGAQTSKALEGVRGVDLAFDANPRRSERVSDQVGQAWVLGTGTRGQRVGVTSLTWRDGATGWAPDGVAEVLQDEKARVERRLEALKKRLDPAGDPGMQLRLQTSVTQVEAELSAMDARLAASQGLNAHRIRSRHVMLDDTLPDHPATAEALSRALDRMEGGAPVTTAVQGTPRLAPRRSPYAGADACAKCHPTVMAQWQATAHAGAWQSLVDDRHASDHACFSCHVTGANQPGGPIAPEAVGGLRDVQCEACHGAARAHVDSPTEVKPVRAPGVEVCTGCHDGERDMGRFDVVTYLPKVAHREGGAR